MLTARIRCRLTMQMFSTVEITDIVVFTMGIMLAVIMQMSHTILTIQVLMQLLIIQVLVISIVYRVLVTRDRPDSQLTRHSHRHQVPRQQARDRHRVLPAILTLRHVEIAKLRRHRLPHRQQTQTVSRE